MKHYLIVDVCSDYRELADVNDLKYLLIEQTIQDSDNNYEDKDIIRQNIRTLAELAKKEKPDNIYLKEQLAPFGFKVIDLLELQRDLFDIKDYFDYIKKENVETFNDVIERVNKEVNK